MKKLVLLSAMVISGMLMQAQEYSFKVTDRADWNPYTEEYSDWYTVYNTYFAVDGSDIYVIVNGNWIRYEVQYVIDDGYDSDGWQFIKSQTKRKSNGKSLVIKQRVKGSSSQVYLYYANNKTVVYSLKRINSVP